MNHEQITPFVCFGWGCDFVESFTLAKVSMLNEFYNINRPHVFKKDGSAEKNRFAPISMYFRETEWKRSDMYEILKEVGETSLRYYLH